MNFQRVTILSAGVAARTPDPVAPVLDPMFLFRARHVIGDDIPPFTLNSPAGYWGHDAPHLDRAATTHTKKKKQAVKHPHSLISITKTQKKKKGKKGKKRKTLSARDSNIAWARSSKKETRKKGTTERCNSRNETKEQSCQNSRGKNGNNCSVSVDLWKRVPKHNFP